MHNDTDFQQRMDANTCLGIMRQVFFEVAETPEHDKQIEQYLTAHDRALAILAGLTGEVKE